MKFLGTIIRNTSLLLLHRFTKDEEKKKEIERIADGGHKASIVGLIVVIIVIMKCLSKVNCFSF